MSVTDTQARWLVYLLHQGAMAKMPEALSKVLQTHGVITRRPGERAWSLTPEGYEIAKRHEANGVSGVTRPLRIQKPKPPPRAYVPTDVELRAAIKFLRGEPGQTGVKQETLDWMADRMRQYMAARAKAKAELQAKKRAKKGRG